MNYFTLIGQMITFTIFVWVILKYVLPPIMGAIEERQEKIATGLAAADKAKHSLEKAKHASNDLTNEAKKRSVDIIHSAEGRAKELVEDAKAQAKTEGDRQIELAQAEIQQEVQRLKEDLRSRVSDLVLQGSKRVIADEIDAAKHAKLIEDLAKKL